MSEVTAIGEHTCGPTEHAFAEEAAAALKELCTKYQITPTIAYAMVGCVLGDTAAENCTTQASVNALLNTALLNMRAAATRSWVAKHGDQGESVDFDGLGRPAGRA